MTEIYRDTAGKVLTLGIAGATVTAVKFVRNGTDIPATPSGNDVVVPYSLTYLNGEFDVVWTYTHNAVSFVRTDRHNVVCPYFTQAELVENDPDMSTLTTTQVIKLERLVRGVIDHHAGQNFGYEAGTIKEYGTGDSVLRTSKRVLSITSIALALYPDLPLEAQYRVLDSGFVLERVEPDAEYTVKTDNQDSSVPFGSAFRNNSPYLVTGYFGWYSIPYDVNLAALILAEQFSCDETLWRDRYIKSIRGEGFDLEFRSDAFVGTGSVTADQLLSQYVVNKLAII